MTFDLIAYQLMKYIAVLLGCITILGLPYRVWQWLAVRRLYGGIPWSLVGQMAAYANKAVGAGPRNILLSATLFAALGIGIGEAWYGAPLIGGEHRSLLLLFVVLSVWMLDRYLAGLLPPSALFLGTSRHETILMLSFLKAELRPYRAVSLLTPKEHVPTPVFSSFFSNNLRTRHNHEWRTIVHHLMDVVPIIIFDEASSTKNVDAERRRAEKRHLLHRTIFFEVPVSPRSLETATCRQNVDLRIARDVASELASILRPLLKNPVDTIGRRAAQRAYTEMYHAVPPAVRYNPDINAALIKGHYLARWQYERFLRECKGISVKYAEKRHVEEIPSIISKVDEHQYLYESRAYEECENIAVGALELAECTPCANQGFNIANAHNKLGKYARFRQDWVLAEWHLSEAIRRLNQILSICSESDRRDTMKELADAHFLLGEVYGGRAIETNSTTDRAAAETQFQAAERLDRDLLNIP